MLKCVLLNEWVNTSSCQTQGSCGKNQVVLYTPILKRWKWTWSVLTLLVIHSKPSTQNFTPQLNSSRPFTQSCISDIYWFPKRVGSKVRVGETVMNRTDTAPALRGTESLAEKTDFKTSTNNSNWALLKGVHGPKGTQRLRPHLLWGHAHSFSLRTK